MGLEYAQTQCYNNLFVEGDPQLLINIIHGIQVGPHIHKLSTSWRLESLVERVTLLISNTLILIPLHIRWTRNIFVNILANYGHMESSNPMAAIWNCYPTYPMKATCWKMAQKYCPTPDGVTFETREGGEFPLPHPTKGLGSWNRTTDKCHYDMLALIPHSHGYIREWCSLNIDGMQHVRRVAIMACLLLLNNFFISMA